VTEYFAVDGSTSACELAASGSLIVDALPSGLGQVVFLMRAFLQPDATRA